MSMYPSPPTPRDRRHRPFGEPKGRRERQTVTVTGVDDAVADGNVAYTIVTAAATSNSSGESVSVDFRIDDDTLPVADQAKVQ